MNEYEEKIKELDTVIARLESGDISLQEAMDLYRRGNELTVACTELLQQFRTEAQRVMEETEQFIQGASRQ